MATMANIPYVPAPAPSIAAQNAGPIPGLARAASPYVNAALGLGSHVPHASFNPLVGTVYPVDERAPPMLQQSQTQPLHSILRNNSHRSTSRSTRSKSRSQSRGSRSRSIRTHSPDDSIHSASDSYSDTNTEDEAIHSDSDKDFAYTASHESRALRPISSSSSDRARSRGGGLAHSIERRGHTSKEKRKRSVSGHRSHPGTGSGRPRSSRSRSSAATGGKHSSTSRTRDGGRHGGRHRHRRRKSDDPPRRSSSTKTSKGREILIGLLGAAVGAAGGGAAASAASSAGRRFASRSSMSLVPHLKGNGGKVLIGALVGGLGANMAEKSYRTRKERTNRTAMNARSIEEVGWRYDDDHETLRYHRPGEEEVHYGQIDARDGFFSNRDLVKEAREDLEYGDAARRIKRDKARKKKLVRNSSKRKTIAPHQWSGM